MCGIVGGMNINWKNDPRKDICHRGPDSQGTWVDDSIYLGHTRLSIQDLSSAGNQPMFNKNERLIIIFNGEIYNHWEVRHLLESKGYKFKSTSDTETLLNAWNEWGVESLNKFNGIYSFAIYDRHLHRLYIARDPFGVKPLYLYQNGNQFAFSSELKTFMNIEEFDCTIDPKALIDYLSFLWAPGERTMYKKVVKVLPGEILELDTKAGLLLSKKKFSKDYFKGEYWDLTESEWIDKLETTLLKAVEKQLLSDVPVGFFLSGGLDSSLLVAMARKLNPEKSFDCFTINTEIEKGREGFAEDLPYARKIAKYLQVELHEVNARSEGVANFDKMIWHLDEPQADLAPINVLQIATLARNRDTKVLIGGAAGDDIFSGYRRHQALSLERAVSKVPDFIMALGRTLINTLPGSKPTFRRLQKLSRDWGLTFDKRIMGYFNWLPDNEIVFDLLSPEVKENVKQYDPYQYGLNILKNKGKMLSPLDQMLLLEQTTFLVDHNLNYTDKLSMAVGVEARVPYLDFDLVELAGHIPSKFKLKGNETKYLLKKVAERYLPKDVIYRPKTGFGAPVRDMVSNDFEPMINERLNPQFIKDQGIFNSEKIQEILEAHRSGAKDFGYTILSLLAIQSWLKQFDWKL
jgi:asparagine synthase (glutamine-hydrolysing)